VRIQECGCSLPNNRGLIAIGHSSISHDCSKRFTCQGPQQNVRIESLPRCSPNANCRGDNQGQPKCFCRNGFIGNGYDCRLIIKTTQRPLDPCKQHNACGRGATCRNNNGKALCFCRNKIVPNNQVCCSREFAAA
jgi:hypothetical protein